MVSVGTVGRIATVAALGAMAVIASTPLGAQAISPALYAGLSWRCVGPFDGGPVGSVTGVPGEAGIYVITTPSGGAWKTTDGGDTWSSIDHQSVSASGADPHGWIDPANPRRIARTDAQGIAVSLDGGATWTASHHLPIAEIASIAPRAHAAEPATRRRMIDGTLAIVSIVDPTRPGLVFAGTSDAVYVSVDDGVTWESLRLNMPPGVRINDLDIEGDNLVAATQGRSVWELDDISPLRQVSAATASAAAFLFKPVAAVLGTSGANLDYYLGPSTHGEVRLDILDGNGRVVHAATSASTDAADQWLPVVRPLASAPGQHRVVWNLRLDPPPAPQHQYAQKARALFEDMPADPDGPRVLAGGYRVRLSVAGQVFIQPLEVRRDPRAVTTPAALQAERDEFRLAMKIYDAMQVAHRAFVQLARARAQVKPLLGSLDPDVAAAATDLDTQLSAIDGSDWTGLVIPDDESGEVGEVDEKEGKHPDFVPPAPVSVSKDYDDPTSVLGRRFANVDRAPAFVTLSTTLGGILTTTTAAQAAPDATTFDTYQRACEQLSGVLDTWRTINAADLPRLNTELAARKLPPLPVVTTVSTIACGSKHP